VVRSTPRPQFTPGKEPVPILQEAGWAPGPVWTGVKSRPHRDSIPDLPACSQLLHRLSYRANDTIFVFDLNNCIIWSVKINKSAYIGHLITSHLFLIKLLFVQLSVFPTQAVSVVKLKSNAARKGQRFPIPGLCSSNQAAFTWF